MQKIHLLACCFLFLGFGIIKEVEAETYLNHIYFLTTRNGGGDDFTSQRVGSAYVYDDERIEFRKFAADNVTSILFTVHAWETVMYYGIKARNSSPFNSQMIGFSMNTTILNSPVHNCIFKDQVLLQYPIAAMSRSTNSNETQLAYIMVGHDNTVSLFTVVLFGRDLVSNSACQVNHIRDYIVPGATDLSTGVLGSFHSDLHKRFIFLHNTLGLVFLTLPHVNETNNETLVSTFPIPNAASLGANADLTTGDLFVVQSMPSQQSTRSTRTKQQMKFKKQKQTLQANISRYSFHTQNITLVTSIIDVGKLAYDSSLQVFILATSTDLVIYNYGGAEQFSSPLSTKGSWLQMNYQDGNIPSFCPNGCFNRGACEPDTIHGGNTCKCNSGWDWSDCSNCIAEVFCHGHGVCKVDPVGNRTCDCVFGWKVGSTCAVCNPGELCNGNGECNSAANGQCTCFSGFYGSNCSSCNSSILCNTHGDCNPNGTCSCHRFWGGDSCLRFEIPNRGLSLSVLILNYITQFSFAVAVIVALAAIIFSNFNFTWPQLVINFAGIEAGIVYFQSLALLLNNSMIYYIFDSEFRFYHLFLLDLSRALPEYFPISFLTESGLFFPKGIVFILGIIVVRFVNIPRARGILLQISFWIYFTFVSSLFSRFQQGCPHCTPSYNVIATVVAVIFLIMLMYLKYRLWKVLTEYKHYFEISNDDGDTFYVTAEDFSEYSLVRFFWRLSRYVFFAWSDILTFFFTRLCDAVEQPQEVQRARAPPITPRAKKRKTKYQPESSVREFLDLMVKENHLDVGDLDLTKLVAMLKGNWYTTVADLRSLSEVDAEKLGIPKKLWASIQEELPKEENADAYTALNTLVQSRQRDHFMQTYQCLGQDFTLSHLLFKLDQLLLRYFLWGLLYISLWDQPLTQLILILVFQMWYSFFLVYHRPYKNFISQTIDITCQISIVFIIVICIDLYYFTEHYFMMTVVCVINFGVMFMSCLFPFLHNLYVQSIVKKQGKEKTKEQRPLIRDTAKSNSFGPTFHYQANVDEYPRPLRGAD